MKFIIHVPLPYVGAIEARINSMPSGPVKTAAQHIEAIVKQDVTQAVQHIISTLQADIKVEVQPDDAPVS